MRLPQGNALRRTLLPRSASIRAALRGTRRGLSRRQLKHISADPACTRRSGPGAASRGCALHGEGRPPATRPHLPRRKDQPAAMTARPRTAMRQVSNRMAPPGRTTVRIALLSGAPVRPARLDLGRGGAATAGSGAGRSRGQRLVRLRGRRRMRAALPAPADPKSRCHAPAAGMAFPAGSCACSQVQHRRGARRPPLSERLRLYMPAPSRRLAGQFDPRRRRLRITLISPAARAAAWRGGAGRRSGSGPSPRRAGSSGSARGRR